MTLKFRWPQSLAFVSLLLLTASAVEWLRKMSSRLIPAFLCVCLSSCAVTDAILDVPMSLFDDDGNEVETTVGDALADNSDGISSVVGDVLGGVNPLLGLLGAGGAAALLGGARRKKKAALAVADSAAAEVKETKA